MHKAVFFDLDGTLLHTTSDIAMSMNLALERNGLPKRDENEFGGIIGGGALSCVTNACPKGTEPELLARVCRDFNDIYDDNYCVKTELYPGVSELINELSNRKIRLAVITNKTETTAIKIINHFFQPGLFEYILGCSDKFKPKPDPEIGLYLCNSMALKPSEVLYVGDSGSDMTFGNNAGFYPVGALWGYRSREELIQNGAAAVVESPEGLVEFLI